MKSAAPESNAVTQRLEKLQSLYQGFRENPKAILCHWAINDDEVKMMEAFVQYEHSELGVFPDFFFGLISSFSDAKQYSQSLLEEVNDWIDTNSDELQEKGVKMSFPRPKYAESPGVFLNTLSLLAEAASGLDHVVAVLRPVEVYDFNRWEDWMLSLVQGKIPSKVRLMVWLTDSQSSLPKLHAIGKEKIQSIVPDLDMPEAMRELASTGNPADPSVQFRLLFLDLSQAASAKDFEKMKSLGEKALNIVQQQKDWEHLEVTVYASMGNFMFPYPALLKEALKAYQKAHQVAGRLYETKHPLGTSLFIQTHNFIGAAQLSLKNHEEAALFYESAISVAKENEMFAFQQMEASRMAGFCYLQTRNIPKAWGCYWQALVLAEQLSEKFPAEKVFLSIGAGLRAATKTAESIEKELIIKEKMSKLVGEDWLEKIEIQKIKP